VASRNQPAVSRFDAATRSSGRPPPRAGFGPLWPLYRMSAPPCIGVAARFLWNSGEVMHRHPGFLTRCPAIWRRPYGRPLTTVSLIARRPRSAAVANRSRNRGGPHQHAGVVVGGRSCFGSPPLDSMVAFGGGAPQPSFRRSRRLCAVSKSTAGRR